MSFKSAGVLSVVYSPTPPATLLLGQLWMDISTVPGTLYQCTVLSPLTYAVVGPGGGGGAPVGAQYVVLSLDATLTGERVLTAGAGITIVDGGANNTVTISSSGGSASAAFHQGEDGLDGDSGPPGQKGDRGGDGSAGAPGQDGIDGEDGNSIVGQAGPAGPPAQIVYFEADPPEDPQVIPGPAGPQGPSAPHSYSEPDPPDDPIVIPGPKGDTGQAGQPGPPGDDGLDGVDGASITGPAGLIGATGLKGAQDEDLLALINHCLDRISFLEATQGIVWDDSSIFIPEQISLTTQDEPTWAVN